MGQLSDPLLLLDGGLHVLEANASAYRLLGLPADGSLLALRTGSGSRLQDWLRQSTQASEAGRRGPPAPTLALADGSRAQISLLALQGDEAARWLLHAQPVAPRSARPAGRAVEAPASPPGEPSVPPANDVAPWAAELLQIFWSSPFPAFVLDARLQLLAVNAAFAELCGHSAEGLRGRALGELLGGAERNRLLAASRPAAVPAEFSLRDAQGHERTMRCTQHLITDAGQPVQRLCVLQDCTAELAAREQAERAQAEMEQWFALSPQPMVLFDDNGLLLRANSAFTALSLSPLATLHDASAELQQLLAWSDGRPIPALQQAQPAGQALLTQAMLVEPGGRTRWLQGRLRPVASLGGRQRRYMAVLEDRSLEQERDLAHQQLDALMDTAGVGLATFQQDAGWLRPRALKSGGGTGRNTLAGLQGISRDIVEPSSLPEFERLQKALKSGERIEVRYAVRHPELGRRWLLTRVEPGRLSTGQRTTSVVTLDLSAQHQAERRSEQLLRELTTIMDGASLGLAYLRGAQLLRSNRGFAEMLGLPDDTAPGTPVAQLFAAVPELRRQVLNALPRLADKPFETEFVQVGSPRWLSLSLRPVAVAADEQPETIVVISDISRLKAQQAELETLVQDRELMFNLSDVGMAILRQGHIERANQALASMSGYRIDELDKLDHRALFESGSAFEQQQSVMQAALAEGGLWRGERRLRRRDGSLLWVQVSKRVMRPGVPDAGVIATYVNVDERWRAQQSLMLQTERERAVLDSVLVGIVTVGRSGIEWMNRSARRMFGGDLVEFLGQPISTVATDAVDHPFRSRHFDELVEGQAETFECRLKARDGREFWVIGNAVATSTEAADRQITYALLDIERRRQAEAQSQQAQASLRRIIATAPLAIALFDAQTLLTEQVNHAVMALTGRGEHELLGATPELLFGAAQGAELRRDLEAALQTEAVMQREYRVEIAGQARLWDVRLLHLAGIADASGQAEPEQVLLVASDVTEQRAAADARLAAAIAQRELLVKEVHHRIKNNLQGVAGLLQQIAARRPEVAGVIGEAVSQVQAIAQVYGLQVGSSGPLRVKSVVEAIVGSVQRASGQPIRLEVQSALPRLAHQWALPEAESIPIALTLNELLGNAMKHSGHGGGEVSCTLICEQERVTLSICNEGQLPAGFDLAQVRGGVSGLGLVRALLPRRSAKLSLEQHGTQVHSSIELRPPSITLLEPL